MICLLAGIFLRTYICTNFDSGLAVLFCFLHAMSSLMSTKTGVYTKNRNFRLYKSSKVGKNAAFTLAEDNKFIAAPAKGRSPQESVFLASLICNVRYESLPEPNDSMCWKKCGFEETWHLPLCCSVRLASPIRGFLRGTHQSQKETNFQSCTLCKTSTHCLAASRLLIRRLMISFWRWSRKME